MRGILETLTAAGMSAEEAERKRALFERAEKALDEQGAGRGGRRGWFVPGRIEVFGKHTDYAGGRSLLAAVERGICVVMAEREDRLVRVTDARRGLATEMRMGDEENASAAATDWTIYPRTVVRRLTRNFGGAVHGAEVAFASDLPQSAGLSSSSALVTAIFTALAERNLLAELPEYRAAIHSREELAGYLGAVENGMSFGPLGGEAGVGTTGGSEDHTAMLCCRAGRLSQFSFCPVRAEGEVALPREWTFVVGASGVAAEKAGAAREAYNRAAETAKAITELWRAASGRNDATLAAALGSGPGGRERIRDILGRGTGHRGFSSEELAARLEQFCEESNMLVPGAADAFRREDITALGRLAERSQEGAERGLRNQVAETIELVRLARELGAGAASAFGAGFGGSVWAVTRREEASEFCARWERAYSAKFPRSAEKSEFFASGAGPGLTRVF